MGNDYIYFLICVLCLLGGIIIDRVQVMMKEGLK